MMKSDIEIAQECKLLRIEKIAEKLNLTEDDYEVYGKYKAKIELSLLIIMLLLMAYKPLILKEFKQKRLGLF